MTYYEHAVAMAYKVGPWAEKPEIKKPFWPKRWSGFTLRGWL